MRECGGMLVSNQKARELDVEASGNWGLNTFALVEGAGRACARVFIEEVKLKTTEKYLVLAGSGNNAADALVMLKTLVLEGYTKASDCVVFVTRLPSPASQASAVEKIGVKILEWDKEKASAALAGADFVIDGIAGTGLKGALKDNALEMANAVKGLDGKKKPIVVSIDIPSGNFDGFRVEMAAVKADITLAIEPRKICLYTPAARAYAGKIISVNGIFPKELLAKHGEAELICWEDACQRVPAVEKTHHKYQRGLVEIRAGSVGASGAALLASGGSQAAGAGLVRLIVDPSLYPVVAPACSGVMAVPGGLPDTEGRFSPSAVLLGPGWGRTEDRKKIFESFLSLEEKGIPLLLDADALPLAKDAVFHGNAILTPHTGEAAALFGVSKEEMLSDTVRILKEQSSKRNAHILFKSHVMYAASPDGRLGIIDGMNPLLACGGTGDVLSGFCAAIASRLRAMAAFDGYICACAAASLLIKCAESEEIAGKFIDPAQLLSAASFIAGSAWLK
jgi:NAD(P)H-hydrate epimerase